MKNLFFLVTAYSLLWIILFGYVFALLRKQQVLFKEFNRLKTVLKKQVREATD